MHGSSGSIAAQLPNASGGISRLAYAKAKAAGLNANQLLARAGISLHEIENPQIFIKVRDQITFLNHVATELNDDRLGFNLAKIPDLREVGLLYYVLSSSETFIDALNRAARYSAVVNEGIRQNCIDDNKSVGLSINYVGVNRHLDRHQIEFWMTILVRIGRQLTGLDLRPTRVRFIHRRASIGDYVKFYGGDVQFGAPTDDIIFPARVRDCRLVGSDPYLNKLLVQFCEQTLAYRRRAPSSFQTTVENCMAPLLPHGGASAAEIARRLGVSQRTLSRRLSAEGLTFQKLLDWLRADLAQRYLEDRDLPISQVAWLLGYREIGAFSHAFKRWTGRTPREARSGFQPPAARDKKPK